MLLLFVLLVLLLILLPECYFFGLFIFSTLYLFLVYSNFIFLVFSFFLSFFLNFYLFIYLFILNYHLHSFFFLSDFVPYVNFFPVGTFCSSFLTFSFFPSFDLSFVTGHYYISLSHPRCFGVLTFYQNHIPHSWSSSSLYCFCFLFFPAVFIHTAPLGSRLHPALAFHVFTWLLRTGPALLQYSPRFPTQETQRCNTLDFHFDWPIRTLFQSMLIGWSILWRMYS